MSDHAWVQEHVAAYVAGGLTAGEAERLERHVAECADCTDALTAATSLDRGLAGLFAPVRPGPELEDRAVQAVRVGPRRRLVSLPTGWPRKALAVAASIAFLGTFGFLAASMLNNGRLPLPGERWAAALRSGPVVLGMADGGFDDSRSMASGGAAEAGKDFGNEDAGLRSDLNAALTDLDRLRQANAKYTGQAFAEVTDLPDQRGWWAAVPPPPGTPGAGMSGGFAGGIGGFGGGIAGGPGGPPGVGYSVDLVRPPMKGYDIRRPDDYSLRGPLFDPTAKPDNNNAGSYYFRPGDARPGQPKPGGAVNPTGATPDSVVMGGQPEQPPKGDPKKNPEPGQPKAPDPEAGPRRVVIRSGDMEFEITSFDAAVATVTKLVTGIKGAFVATVNSEKLPNGKVKGSITVRTPPEHLDTLVLDLRRDLGQQGELKGMRVASTDITKQYTDLESRLKAARTMEQRLLTIIKDGKGEIKQLLEAERELGVWRTKIEEIEGELRYYSNLAALSTLTIALAEKDLRVAAGITQQERVQAGVEVEDVETAFRQLLAAVADAKGRVTKSELKQLAAGQYNAELHFEVNPEASGPLRDRLRQIGRVARLEIDRVQQPAAGPVAKDAPVKTGDAVFLVQVYNLANVAPRETAMLQVAVPDVPAAYQSLRDAVGAAKGRVLTAQLNEADRQNVTAQLDFEVRRADEPAVAAALAAAGETVARQVGRSPEGDNVTDAKVLYRVTLLSASRLRPRTSTVLAVEVADVDGTAAVFSAEVAEAKGRQVDAQFNRERAGKVTAKLAFEVPLAAAPGLVERFKSAGVVRVHQSARDPQAPEGKYAVARIDVTLTNADRIVSEDDGLWPPVRRGLSYSASVLLTSLTWVVFGLCVVLPWAVVGYGGYRAVRWASKPRPAGTVTPTTPPPPAGSAV